MLLNLFTFITITLTLFPSSLTSETCTSIPPSPLTYANLVQLTHNYFDLINNGQINVAIKNHISDKIKWHDPFFGSPKDRSFLDTMTDSFLPATEGYCVRVDNLVVDVETRKVTIKAFVSYTIVKEGLFGAKVGSKVALPFLSILKYDIYGKMEEYYQMADWGLFVSQCGINYDEMRVAVRGY
eukprot:TRINITY_DN6323_c0_g1_i1.p1 TRINITY_DN6323_c0_g1~~TRINITY_DN6323_c0_g1_i1.p1  ORF type:complete len:183 (-),score=27.71 TRINITY_DN6323_c0_g1_i1:72-620(-)